MIYTILVVSPGSRSTKGEVYRNEEVILAVTVDHPPAELNQFDTVADRLDSQKSTILKVLEDPVRDIPALDCLVAREGLVRPLPHGIYRINEKMKKGLTRACYGGHPSNLGALSISTAHSSGGMQV